MFRLRSHLTSLCLAFATIHVGCAEKASQPSNAASQQSAQTPGKAAPSDAKQPSIGEQDPSGADEEKTAYASDEEALQGVWEVVFEKVDGEETPDMGASIRLKGDKYHRLGFTPGRPEDFELDVSSDPKHFDHIITWLGGKSPPRYLGIFKIENDELTICSTQIEDLPRPNDFTAEAGSNRHLARFKRVSPEELAALAVAGDPIPIELAGTLDAMIRALKDGDIATFIRTLRPGGGANQPPVEKIAASFSKEGVSDFLKLFRAMRRMKPQLKNGNTEAHFDVRSVEITTIPATRSVIFSRINDHWVLTHPK